MPVFLALVTLVYLVCVAFWPILGFDLVDFDVNDQLVNNPHVHGLSLENVKHILTTKCVSSYYPVRTLSLALDYQIWGLRPIGFKLTGVLIHLANVLLVFWLILRLFGHSASLRGRSKSRWDVFAAAVLAGIVAVHPVVVEPVTWIGGREELLMTLGALGCFHFHFGARQAAQNGAGKYRVLLYHAGAALFCAVACLSNALGAVVPFLITTWDLLTLARPRLRKIVGATAVPWAMGVATILIKQLGYSGDTIAPLAPVLTAEWLRLVFRTYWMNLTALAWPTRLGVLYDWIRPRSFFETEVVWGAVAVGLSCLVLWKLRRHKLILFGLLWFGLSMGPTSQVMLHHVARADRFLYLPLMGLAMAGALAVRTSGALRRPPVAAGAVALGVAVLVALNLLTATQIRTWRNSTTMWTRCVEVAPNNPMAHGSLADSLSREGRFEEAVAHYEASLRLSPDSLESLNNYAIRLATCEEERLRDYERAIRLAERGCELSHWEDWQLRRTLSKACSNYAKVFNSNGQYRESIRFCRTALKADPGFDAPMLNLAVILATCPDEGLRRPEEAVQLAETAVQSAQTPDAVRLRILALAYAAAGDVDKAVTALDRAIRLAEVAGNSQLADELRAELRSHRRRIPSDRGPPNLPTQ